MKLFTNKFKSGGLHEKHVVATWNLGNHLSIWLQTQENQEKPVSMWPVAGPSQYWLVASSPASKDSNTHIVQQIHIRWQQYTQENYNNTHKTTNNNTHKTSYNTTCWKGKQHDMLCWIMYLKGWDEGDRDLFWGSLVLFDRRDWNTGLKDVRWLRVRDFHLQLRI